MEQPSFASIDGFGERLVASGLIDESSLQRAERAGLKSGERLDVVVTRLGLVSEVDVCRTLAGQFGYSLVDLSECPAAPLLPDDLPLDFLRNHRILPIGLDAGAITLAVANPFDTDAIQGVAYKVDRRAVCKLIPPTELERLFDRLYARSATGSPANGLADDGTTDEDVEKLRDLASGEPVIRLVSQILLTAIERGASDVHLEPNLEGMQVRYRIDGELLHASVVPRAMRPAVTSRIKIMARLDIAERRLPQDGRTLFNAKGRDIDLRVSTMPTVGGESIVLRILDKSAVRLDLADLGFLPDIREALGIDLQAPHGMILVTGPTGSGKTTTLYAAISHLNSPDRKIYSIEDPIEFQLAGINQIQVQPKIGLTFANALRSVLRQDPDVIMVGEIRDRETAEIAIQSSLTGHVVLSTIHTNGTVATLTRLLEMGIEDFLLTASLSAILAQRLVRLLCNECAVPDNTESNVKTLMDQAFSGRGQAAADIPVRPRRAVGCPNCRSTGYRGRTVLSELLRIDQHLNGMSLKGSAEQDLLNTAIANGMNTLYQDGLLKVANGMTSLQEVFGATKVP